MLFSVKGNIASVRNTEKATYIQIAENYIVKKNNLEEKRCNFHEVLCLNGLRALASSVTTGTFVAVEGHVMPKKYDKATKLESSAEFVAFKISVLSSKAVREAQKVNAEVSPASVAEAVTETESGDLAD